MTLKFSTRKNPALYEINTLAWLFELSKKMGRRISLGEVPSDEWDRLKKLGIELVWLMGIWERSRIGMNMALHEPELLKVYDSLLPDWTEEDVVGSSYSISAYEPDPNIGTWDDIDSARAVMHRYGLGMILDFIPNHTGIDHHWVQENPDYYIQGSKDDYLKDNKAFVALEHGGRTLYLARGKDPCFPPWADTLQLNYFNPEMRAAMLRELSLVAGHCDGVRCDVAMLLLNDVFQKTWSWAKNKFGNMPTAQELWIQAKREVPDLIWIAEAYWDTERTFHEFGFDYVYDKKLYDMVVWCTAPDVRNYLKADLDFQQKLLRFMENHDEPRAREVFGKDRLVAAATLFATLPGLRLYHHGQLQGKKVRLPLQLRQVADEPTDAETQAFYEKLLAITNQDVFHAGLWQLVDITSGWDESFRNLIAYTWQYEKRLKLVVVNLSFNPSQARIPLPGMEERSYIMNDELNEKTYTRDGKEMRNPGLHVILDRYQAHIFDFV